MLHEERLEDGRRQEAADDLGIGMHVRVRRSPSSSARPPNAIPGPRWRAGGGLPPQVHGGAGGDPRFDEEQPTRGSPRVTIREPCG